MNLLDTYNKQYTKKPVEEKKEIQPKQVNLVLHMPEVSGLIKHLDLLYSKILINNMEQSNTQSNTQNISWFNPGQGSKSQSDSVN